MRVLNLHHYEFDGIVPMRIIIFDGMQKGSTTQQKKFLKV